MAAYTLNERTVKLDLHASRSYVVSHIPYSPPARTSHYSFSDMSHGANAPSYPPQQQRAPLTEPHSATGMTVLIDKIMGQLNLMKDEVTSKHDTHSEPTPSHLQLYKEPPPVHYEYPDPQWYAHPPQYAADQAYGPSDRFQRNYEPVPRSKKRHVPPPNAYTCSKTKALLVRASFHSANRVSSITLEQDPSEFAHLKFALHNLLSEDGRVVRVLCYFMLSDLFI